MVDPPADHDDDLGRAVAELTGAADRQALGRVAQLARSSMRAAGARSVATGRWLAEAVVDAAPHLPIRDLDTLRAHHGDLSRPAMAEALVRSASRTTAGMGAAMGAAATAHELLPPTWLAIPVELVVETLAVVAAEMKLVAELHEVYGRPVTGTPAQRGITLARAWAERRGVTARTLAEPDGMAQILGRTTRREVVKLLQRRLARRGLGSLSTVAPFLVGAAAGATLNARATRSLGEAVALDLAADAGAGR